ncbi:glycyl-radical enzyme activating protein [Vibrio sp. JC009]|uniref:glycyl-radical enzyme activating protein n=1 Tax=Vibrio sp. JC009 TaxID=2912314 RepID=UPI0023B0F0CB|nr:glycyl-radical enzyme activating protein [Vibrio sp. JC009]WED22564.1 glycyl-radical enzyme activating protein [Vibrio sp. JC009]
MKPALISNIQRFSLDDGPGIRTTIFFKGCNLRCAWCHNPETIGSLPTLQFIASNCTSCGNCSPVCTQKAHKTEGYVHSFDRTKCIGCGDCVESCAQDALELIGKSYSPGKLFTEIVKDRHYYSTSGGGVTFSGGEAALQVDFILEVAKLCKAEGISMVLDTAGNVPFKSIEKLLPYISLFLYDLKCIDSEKHKRWTKVDNRRIIRNLQLIDQSKAKYVVRIPVIPNFNTSVEEHSRIAQFVATLSNPSQVQLLPYHSYGAGKYEAIGLVNTTKEYAPPTEGFLQKALQCYHDLGLSAEIA